MLLWTGGGRRVHPSPSHWTVPGLIISTGRIFSLERSCCRSWGLQHPPDSQILALPFRVLISQFKKPLSPLMSLPGSCPVVTWLSSSLRLGLWLYSDYACLFLRLLVPHHISSLSTLTSNPLILLSSFHFLPSFPVYS